METKTIDRERVKWTVQSQFTELVGTGALSGSGGCPGSQVPGPGHGPGPGVV